MIAPITLAELRAVDLFDGIDDEQLAEWVAVAVAREYEPGETIAEQDEDPPGLILLVAGTGQSQMLDRGRIEPMGRQQSPTWIGAISVLTDDRFPVRIPSRDGVPRGDHRARRVPAPRAHPAVRPPADHAPGRPRHAAPPGHRPGPRAPRVARHDGRRPRARAQQPGRRGAPGRLAAARRRRDRAVDAREVREGRRRARRGRAARRPPAGGDRPCRQGDGDGHARRRRRGGRAARTARGARRPRALAARRAARVRLHRRDLAGSCRRARGPGDARRAALGRGDADDRTCLVRAVRVDRADLRARRRRQELHLHGPRRRARGRPARGPGDDARRARPQAQAHLDQGRPRLRPRAAADDRPRLRAQPGVDEPARQRDRRARRAGTITITTRAEASCAVIDVADDGPGIPADVRDHVFDPFFTTKDVGAGTGLGLATARRIVVDRHDGSIAVQSEPGHTVFHVRLPLTQH